MSPPNHLLQNTWLYLGLAKKSLRAMVVAPQREDILCNPEPNSVVSKTSICNEAAFGSLCKPWWGFHVRFAEGSCENP